MKRDTGVFLEDILDSIGRLEEYTLPFKKQIQQILKDIDKQATSVIN